MLIEERTPRSCGHYRQRLIFGQTSVRVPNFGPRQMLTPICGFERPGIVRGEPNEFDLLAELVQTFLTVVEHDHAIAGIAARSPEPIKSDRR